MVAQTLVRGRGRRHRWSTAQLVDLAVRRRRDRRPAHAARRAATSRRARATSSRTTAPTVQVDELDVARHRDRRDAGRRLSSPSPTRRSNVSPAGAIPQPDPRRRPRVPRRPEVHHRARVGPRSPASTTARCGSASPTTPRTRSATSSTSRCPRSATTVAGRRHLRRARVDQVGQRHLRAGHRRGGRPQRRPRRDPRAGQQRPVRRRLALRGRAVSDAELAGRPAGRRGVPGHRSTAEPARSADCSDPLDRRRRG